MEHLTVFSDIAQTIAIMLALVLSFIALTRDRGKDMAKDKQQCVEHSETIKQLKANNQVLFDKLEKVESHGQSIAVINNTLKNIEKKLDQIFDIVYEPTQKKRGVV